MWLNYTATHTLYPREYNQAVRKVCQEQMLSTLDADLHTMFHCYPFQNMESVHSKTFVTQANQQYGDSNIPFQISFA